MEECLKIIKSFHFLYLFVDWVKKFVPVIMKRFSLFLFLQKLKSFLEDFWRSLLDFSRPFRSSCQRCSVKKVFLEISQNSQKNTCARVSFLNRTSRDDCFSPLKRFYHLFTESNKLKLFNGQEKLPEVFYKKVVLRNFAKFTGKHLC